MVRELVEVNTAVGGWPWQLIVCKSIYFTLNEAWRCSTLDDVRSVQTQTQDDGSTPRKLKNIFGTIFKKPSSPLRDEPVSARRSHAAALC
jgi:hypothetical protein